MFRRLMSHLLISLAVFSLTTTFLIWVIDGALLNPTKLTQSLRGAGVPAAIAATIPKAIKDEKATPAEVADMQTKIRKVVTADYVDQKVTGAVNTLGAFIRHGTPQPTLDITDFPARLRASGVDTGGDIEKSFAKPIELNKDGKLNMVPKFYHWLKMAKVLGVTLFAFFLIIEWFVAEKGMKLKRISRIFLHTAFWSFVYWLALVLVPDKVLAKIQTGPNYNADFNELAQSFTKAIQSLLSVYFLGFAITCAVIMIALYGTRVVLTKIAQQKNAKKPKPVYPTPTKANLSR